MNTTNTLLLQITEASMLILMTSMAIASVALIITAAIKLVRVQP